MSREMWAPDQKSSKRTKLLHIHLVYVYYTHNKHLVKCFAR